MGIARIFNAVQGVQKQVARVRSVLTPEVKGVGC
jgi:hypothetical protein